MPVILGLFCLLPLAVGLVLEYLACRLPRRKWWRALPPALAAVLAAAVAAGRLSLWTDAEVSPLTQLLIFPGLPGVSLLAGCLLGWRLWRHIWRPRIIDKRR